MPSVPVFVKICDSLQISPAYLLGNEVQVPVTDLGWEEMAEEISQLSDTSGDMVKEVLHSLIENLAEKESRSTREEERYGVIDHVEFEKE